MYIVGAAVLTLPVGELGLGDADGADDVDVSPGHSVAAGRQETGETQPMISDQ